MSCCGGRREQLRVEQPDRHLRSPRTMNGLAIFEYTGPSRTVAKGGVTGRGYSFVGYGAQVSVDPRDAESLAAMPYLQQVLR